jgi:hypothetical protein
VPMLTVVDRAQLHANCTTLHLPRSLVLAALLVVVAGSRVP